MQLGRVFSGQYGPYATKYFPNRFQSLRQFKHVYILYTYYIHIYIYIKVGLKPPLVFRPDLSGTRNSPHCRAAGLVSLQRRTSPRPFGIVVPDTINSRVGSAVAFKHCCSG